MRLYLNRLRETARALLKPSHALAALAFGLVAVLGIFADSRNRSALEQEQRAEVLGEIALIRARIEGNINSNLQLVRGMVSTISTEPGMTQQRFAEIASHLFREDSQLRHIAGAPGLILSLMYPLKGNEKAIGLDYSKNPQQRETALRARDTGKLVLAGPVDLVQGGQAFIGRFPVFVNAPGGTREFWGILSAVVDMDRLYRDSGLLDPDLPVEIAITGKDALGADGALFYGSDKVLKANPVTAEIVLPAGGRWRIAATPRGGWDANPQEVWIFRLAVLLAAVLVVAPLVISGQLGEERQRHIGELRLRETELERLSHRLELALEVSQIGVWEYDLDTQDTRWDERTYDLYGVTPGAAVDHSTWTGAIHPDDLAHAVEDFQVGIRDRERYASEFRIVLPDGSVRHLRARGAIYHDADGSRRMIGAEWDISADIALNRALERAKDLAEKRYAELETAKAIMEHNALHDALTGLPNRRYLDQVLERHAATRIGEDGTAALLHIDLDRFKQINDTLGHAAGDAMLVHAADVLKANVRENDFVARIGGDEFVVFCIVGGPEYLAALADRIIEHMRQPVIYEGHECRFGVSVGIASAPGGVLDPKRLLVNADIALYRAKSRGRNRFEFFTDELQAEIVRTKRVADEILTALEREEFVTYYQPQFDAKTLEIIGVEALARWRHPRRGVLAPDYFLKVAEELNVVPTIDRIVLEQALRHSAGWMAKGVTVPKISVNVSARRLRDEELIDSLAGLAFPPGAISFELVESIFLDESDDLLASNIERVKGLGFDIEIDDFGSGHASIVALLKLKPRRLKIDRQLVMPIATSPAQRQLVASIVEIGKSLGVDVIAEGVETMEHARILRDLGCHGLQGYAFARPMTAKDFVEFAQARKWRAAS